MEKINTLYLSLDGIMDPLGKSQILPYLRKLAGKGVVCVLLTLEKRENLQDRVYIVRLKDELAYMGIQWKFLEYARRPYFIAKLRNFLAMLLLSLKIAKENNINFIHARSYVMSVCALILKKFYGMPFLFDMRGFWVDERVESGTWRYGSVQYRIAKYLERVILENADEIISLTAVAADEISGFYFMRRKRNDISVIPTCVDLERFAPGHSGPIALAEETKKLLENSFLVYSGSISTWCMPYEMLLFLQAIQKSFARISFLVLTQEKSLFEDILKKRGSNDVSVRVLTVDYENISGYLSLGMAGLAFYKPGFSRKARCPTKIGEYLACGLPVVINSGLGDTEEMIHKERVGVVLHEFSDPEYQRASRDLTDILSEGNSLRNRCREAARKYFSLDEGVEKYMNVYTRLAGATGSAGRTF